MFPRHGRKHLATHLPQQRVIALGRIGHNVMQRLMHPPNVSGCQTCGHRLDAFSLDRQHQALGVVLDRNHAISVAGGFCKVIQISLEAFRLTGKIKLAKAHSLKVLPNNPCRQANQL